MHARNDAVVSKSDMRSFVIFFVVDLKENFFVSLHVL